MISIAKVRTAKFWMIWRDYFIASSSRYCWKQMTHQASSYQNMTSAKHCRKCKLFQKTHFDTSDSRFSIYSKRQIKIYKFDFWSFISFFKIEKYFQNRNYYYYYILELSEIPAVIFFFKNYAAILCKVHLVTSF